MNNSSKPLKKLPYSTDKKGLVAMYIQDMTERYIINSINEIVKENRGLKFNNRFKKIYHIEFMEFVKTFGVPRGYEE